MGLFFAFVCLLLISLKFSEGQIVPSNGANISLPHDDQVLPLEVVQWWYWTGHLLAEETERKFGFEICVFLVGGYSQLVQVAITDVSNNSFTFDERFWVKRPAVIPNKFSFSSGSSLTRNKLEVNGGNGMDSIFADIGDSYSLNLTLQSLKEPTLHYDGTPHSYSFGGYTYYYSRTSMQTSGDLYINHQKYTVSGSAWFDRQYGDLARAITKGWQWFAIELDSKNEVMLFDFLGKDKESINESYGSITDKEGKTIDLEASEFKVVVLDHWLSPHTNCTYPSGWLVTMQGESYTVKPDILDQELFKRSDMQNIIALSPTYWEGKCSVFQENQLVGKAYVELNGFCPLVA